MKTVMLVEDDPAILDAFSQVLQKAGYNIVAYANGNHLLKDDFELPDALILDKQLSGADGLDLCRLLKTRIRTKNLPLIMLSASPHVREQALKAGANEFLEKPFRSIELLTLLKHYLA